MQAQWTGPCEDRYDTVLPVRRVVPRGVRWHQERKCGRVAGVADVVCIPGAKIDDVRDRLEALPSGYDTITLLVGDNDCDVTPPPPAATIVTKYGGLLDMAQVKARVVTVSSICPRKTTDDTRLTIEAVNAGLVSLCEE